MPRKSARNYKRPLTIQEITCHPLYAQLTASQQRFVSVYLETKSAQDAIRAAYPNTAPGASSTAAISKMFCHTLISKLLALGIGYSLEMGPLSRADLAGLCAERLWGRLQSDTAFLRLLATYAWLVGMCTKTYDIAFLQGLGRYGRYADQRYEQGVKPKLRTLSEEIARLERAGKKDAKLTQSKERHEQKED